MTTRLPTSMPLAIPRSGIARLAYAQGLGSPGDIPSGEIATNTPWGAEELIAGWQTPEWGEGAGHYSAPKRVVIRIDGHITQRFDGFLGNPGFPCGVLNVRYTIGGYVREVLIDAVNQSGLVVWADSVDVKSQWDTRRINRLATLGIDGEGGFLPFVLPCMGQDMACAISSSDDGDTGDADARWLDVIAQDASSEDPTSETSIHPIPHGARAFRFLNALVGGVMTGVPELTTIIAFSAEPFDAYPRGIVELVTNGETDSSMLLVPTGAEWLFLQFPLNTISTFDQPSWIEWIMSPVSPPFAT
jgi:hypothetical protein